MKKIYYDVPNRFFSKEPMALTLGHIQNMISTLKTANCEIRFRFVKDNFDWFKLFIINDLHILKDYEVARLKIVLSGHPELLTLIKLIYE